MSNIQTITVERDEAEVIESCLRSGGCIPDSSYNDLVFVRTAKFPNGYEMDIKVVNAPEEDGGAWTEGVLFDQRGYELGCTDVLDTLLGEFTVWLDDVEYIVKVDAE